MLVHVIPFLRYPEVKEAAQALIDRDAERLVKAGYAVNAILKLGHPAEEIIKVVGRQKVDLLVAGAKGLGAIAQIVPWKRLCKTRRAQCLFGPHRTVIHPLPDVMGRES